MTTEPGLEDRRTSANVAGFLVEVAAAHPGEAALIGADGRARWTFAELTDRAARIASGLVRRGLPPGGRVALLVRDPEAALVLAVATLWAGGTLVAPPRSGSWRSALRAASRTRPSAVVADPATWLALAAVPGLVTVPIRAVTGRRHWPGLVCIEELADDGHAAATEPVARSADTPALISWTTGTTGHPHAVVRTHGVLAAQHAAIRDLRAPLPGDVDLVGLPTMALHDLACGVPMVMAPHDRGGGDGARLRDLASRAAVTSAVGFPVLFDRLVDGAGPGTLSGLRSIHVGGAPVRPGLLDRLALVAPRARVVIVYGATEAEPIAAIDATDVRATGPGSTPGRGMLVGAPCSGIEVRLGTTDGAGRAVPASDGPVGRILVRGDRVARDPVRSDADGWLDTGDLGTIDDDGRLWLLGRTSNALAGGFAPAEVEEPVAELDDVRAAALVSLPGRGASSQVLAVEPATDVAPAALQARIASLADGHGWKLDRIALVRHLPRDTRSGKVDYRRLRTLIR